MPKQKTSKSARLQQYVEQYPVFKTDDKILLCKVCNKTVTAEKTSTVKQHLESAKHKELLERNTLKKTTQQFFDEASSNSNSKANVFAQELCDVFVAADIPLSKLRNKSVVAFLEKYTEFKIPSETTLRTNHVKKLYNATIENIRVRVTQKFVWVSIDETTDVAGRYIANVIIGILDDNDPQEQKYLLNTAVLEKANHSTIARLFDDSIKILGENFNKDSILLFISDAAPYMVKAARAIQVFYPKITHVTCLAHGLHRVCEQIRSIHQNVDRLIANTKKVFLKA